MVLFIYSTWKPALSHLYSYDLNFYISNILLTKGNWVIPPVWFISSEIYFYLLFTAVFFIKRLRHLLAAMAIFGALIVAASILNRVHPLPDYVNAVFNPYVLEFMSGICASLIHIRYGEKIHAGLVFCTGLFLSVAVNILIYGFNMHIDPSPLIRMLIYGIPFAFLCLGAIGLKNVVTGRMYKWFYTLGQASFSVYLLHMIVLQGLFVKTQRVMREYGNGFTFFLEATVIALTAIIIPVLFYFNVEKRVIGYMKRFVTSDT
jgi:peptidoglycan/LPS O-acetylase OafA/YrhL